MTDPAKEFKKIQMDWITFTAQLRKHSTLPENAQKTLAANCLDLYVRMAELSFQLVKDRDKYGWLQRAQHTLYNLMLSSLPLPLFRQLMADENRYRIWDAGSPPFVLNAA